VEHNCAPVNEAEKYPWFPPGEYTGMVTESKIFQHPALRAWKCLVKFKLLEADLAEVVGFFHLGRGEKSRAGRGSRYYRFWVEANGGPPRRGRVMTERIFKGKVFKVLVADTTTRFDGSRHHQSEIYSTVRDVLERVGP
jgi:hypothetical protein